MNTTWINRFYRGGKPSMLRKETHQEWLGMNKQIWALKQYYKMVPTFCYERLFVARWYRHCRKENLKCTRSRTSWPKMLKARLLFLSDALARQFSAIIRCNSGLSRTQSVCKSIPSQMLLVGSSDLQDTHVDLNCHKISGMLVSWRRSREEDERRHAHPSEHACHANTQIHTYTYM